MIKCCESDVKPPKRYRCPVNGREYSSVGIKTILHHLATPWKKELSSDSYYFCSDKDCDIVYFGQDNSVIKKSELRTTVGVKEESPERFVCYCFGVPYSIAEKDSVAFNFVKDKTKQALCSCETSNPSGKCCLKDFPI